MDVSALPAPRLAALDARYAAIGASFKQLTAGSGDLAPAGYNLIPNGVYMVSNATVTAALVGLIYPTFGGSSVWSVIAYHSNGTHTVIATVTIASGARAAQVTSLSYAAVQGDFILCQNTAANGTSYKGLGPQLLLSFGGSITIPTAPAAVTSFTATPGSNFVTLNWTGSSLASDYIVTSNGVPIATTGLTSYQDLGPSGTGLTAGATNVYDVYAAAPLVVGPSSGTPRTSGPASVFNYFTQTDGTLVTADFTTTLGTNAGTSALAVQSTGVTTLTSGAVGTNASQDRVSVAWIKSGNSYSALDMPYEFGMPTSNCVVDLYLCADAVGSVTSLPAYYLAKIEMNAFGYRITYAAGGASTNLTINGSTQATTTSASGTVPWPIGITADTSHFYGLYPDLQPIDGGGAQLLNLYFGTTGQAETIPQSMPLINAIQYTNTQVSAIGAATATHGGFYGWQLLGQQSGTGVVAQKYAIKNLSFIPLSAANH